MQLYDCKVRLNGSVHNVVAKTGISAAEITLLRFIHGQSEQGQEPVIDIVPKGTVNRKESAERAMLAATYSFGEISGPGLVAKILGVPGVPLPQYIEGVDEEAPEEMSTEDAEIAIEAETAKDTPAPAAPVRTRVGRPPKSAAAPVAEQPASEPAEAAA